ncbi:hypothetical protein Pint_27023 [Pistacia integerrima]|uniref:Uncharacterized protein n=1 Tax=Pistacia integerrima TaxID=434235 RepID=A0ACC0YNI5_9ROSI|nr:hypothetical protein Pint_27023 [Pistacia integerrima]
MPHKVKKESNMRWTQSMDDILIDAYLHEHVQGNRSNPSAVEWRSKPAYNYDKLCELFAKDRVNGEDASLNVVTVKGSENDLTSLGCPSEVTSRKLKNICKVKEDNNPIKEVISAVDRAKLYLGDVFLLCANKSSLKDNELLEHLVEIGIEDDDKLERAQTFLLENPMKLRVFYSFPTHRRKSILMKMLENVTT